MQPTRELPAHYRRVAAIDLSRQIGLAVGLTLLALVAFGIVSLVMSGVVAALQGAGRPPPADLDLLQVLGVVVVVLVVHEAVHGVWFWVVTREQPRFGLGPLYAYAAAPGWYIPRDPYLVVGLAPLALLTAAGLLALLVIQDGVLISLVALGVSLNAAGSVGDLAIVRLVVRQPPDALVLDAGPGVAIYVPGDLAAASQRSE